MPNPRTPTRKLDKMRLKDKSAIVTGASRGIGASIARSFALEGANVLVNYNRSETEALMLVESLKEEMKVYGDIFALKGDVSRYEVTKALVAEARRRFGRIDILVNNAGILITRGFLDVTEKDYDKVLGVNLKGAFFLCQHVARFMLAQKSGKIINISSVSGLSQHSGLDYVDYVCSKSGMIGLTRSLAVNLGPYVNVNAICPGTIETDIIATLPKKDKDKMAEESLLKRLGDPEEIANAALFLASNESDFITGEILTVAGGRGMR